MLCDALSDLDKEDEIRNCFPLMDKILETMQMITDVDLKKKSKRCASFLQYYGSCCNYANNWMKSVELHNRAIGILKTTFANEANNMQLLAICYHNLGNAYKHLNYYSLAKTSVESAVLIHEKIVLTDKSNASNLKGSQNLLADIIA